MFRPAALLSAYSPHARYTEGHVQSMSVAVLDGRVGDGDAKHVVLCPSKTWRRGMMTALDGWCSPAFFPPRETTRRSREERSAEVITTTHSEPIPQNFNVTSSRHDAQHFLLSNAGDVEDGKAPSASQVQRDTSMTADVPVRSSRSTVRCASGLMRTKDVKVELD